jgi:ribonucleoside-diphosphate reductase alpha chain
MSAPRNRLPDRRGHEVIDFTRNGYHFTAGVGRFPDGSLAEIFLNSPKVGTPIEAAARDAAVLASVALQFGASVDTIRRALSQDAMGKAAGPLGAVLDILAEGAGPGCAP